MEARISFITLGVADLERATRFYADGLGLPHLGAPPNAAFFDFGIFRLALYPATCWPPKPGFLWIGPASLVFCGGRSRRAASRVEST